MARLNQSQSLSIIIPSFNEASNLPLLLADLNLWPSRLEICVCDACSSDSTHLITILFGARFIQIDKPNRGAQLHHGACNTNGDWLLFLHADSRMSMDWPETIKEIINKYSSKEVAWFFDFKVQGRSIELAFLELAVAVRCNFLDRPYGDQGLLINRSLYQKTGGYKPLYLMEDLDFIKRLSKTVGIKRLGLPLYTNGRRWEKINFISKAWKNAELRRQWRKGESSEVLARKYYTDQK